MSFLNKHKTEAAVNTAPAADGLTGTAEDVDAVMKKYDRESNVRVWEGKPKNRGPFPDGRIFHVLHLPDPGRQEPPGGSFELCSWP